MTTKNPLGFDNSRFDEIDKAALHNALLALKTCPLCRRDLRQVKHSEDGRSAPPENLWACVTCDEAWEVKP